MGPLMKHKMFLESYAAPSNDLPKMLKTYKDVPSRLYDEPNRHTGSDKCDTQQQYPHNEIPESKFTTKELPKD